MQMDDFMDELEIVVSYCKMRNVFVPGRERRTKEGEIGIGGFGIRDLGFGREIVNWAGKCFWIHGFFFNVLMTSETLEQSLKVVLDQVSSNAFDVIN